MNPTNKTLGVRSIFRSASKNKKSKPSVTITPAKFDIEPGKSKGVRVQIKPGGKKPVYGNLLFGVKGMESSRPVQVLVMIVHQGLKLKRIATISEIREEFIATKSRFTLDEEGISHEKTRELLSTSKGNWATDVIADREDRI